MAMAAMARAAMEARLYGRLAASVGSEECGAWWRMGRCSSVGVAGRSRARTPPGSRCSSSHVPTHRPPPDRRERAEADGINHRFLESLTVDQAGLHQLILEGEVHVRHRIVGGGEVERANVTDDVGQALEVRLGTELFGHVGGDALIEQAVVFGALLAVAQDFVSLVDLGEGGRRFGFLLSGARIGVVLERELAVELLQLRRARRAVGAQDLVIVTLVSHSMGSHTAPGERAEARVY